MQLEISDLTHEATGATINKGYIEWRVVGYVPTKKPYYPVKFVGPWPDPLLAIQKTDIKPGVTQPLWVTVYIPQAAVAGNYRGTIKMMADGMEARQISLTVSVYDFILPQENHLKTAFDFYGHITKSRYPQGEAENEKAYLARLGDLNDKFITAMLKSSAELKSTWFFDSLTLFKNSEIFSFLVICNIPFLTTKLSFNRAG